MGGKPKKRPNFDQPRPPRGVLNDAPLNEELSGWIPRQMRRPLTASDRMGTLFQDDYMLYGRSGTVPACAIQLMLTYWDELIANRLQVRDLCASIYIYIHRHVF